MKHKPDGLSFLCMRECNEAKNLLKIYAINLQQFFVVGMVYVKQCFMALYFSAFCFSFFDACLLMLLLGSFGVRVRAQVTFMFFLAQTQLPNEKRTNPCFSNIFSSSLYDSLFVIVVRCECVLCLCLLLYLSSLIELLPLMAKKGSMFTLYNNKPLALSFLCLSCIFNALRLRWCYFFHFFLSFSMFLSVFLSIFVEK